MLVTILYKILCTIIQYGETDKAIGVDMLMERYVTYEDDLWRLDWLNKDVATYSLLKRN